jgi:YbbR domain-containing protein
MKKKRLLFDNLGMKIAAVLLSVVLWFYVTSRGQSEIPLEVPVELKNIPVGLEIVNNGYKKVSLYIKGQERIIRTVKPSDVKLSLDLSKTKSGENIFYIHGEDIQLPHGITVTSINPSSLKIITEKTVSKTVRVIAVVTGEVLRGNRIHSINVDPTMITAEGISSEMRKIKSMKTEPLDVTGLAESVVQELKIETKGKNIRTNPDTVRVTVEIK